MEATWDLSPQSDSSDEEALASMRSAPEPTAAVALCNWIAGHQGAPPRTAALGRETVVNIAKESVRRHPRRVGVLVAVGRMLLVAGELALSLDVLIDAAKLAPREPIVFRLLGEVAFRRGDARRAQRMLERAMAEGMTDPETLAWHHRARLCATERPPALVAKGVTGPRIPPPARMPSISEPPASSVRLRSGVRLASAASWTSSHTAVTRVGND